MGFLHTIRLTIFVLKNNTFYFKQNHGKNCKKHNRFNWEHPTFGTESDCEKI